MVDYDIERIWRGMKARCYYSNAKPYENCDVCYEWLINYESFVEWFLDNLYDCGEQKLELDKDLFSKGEKIYSPETCCLLPKRINVVLAFRKEKYDGLPTGVYMSNSGKYLTTIHKGAGHLSKTFNTVEEASEYYKTNKERHIRELAMAYKKFLPEKIFDALWNFKCDW